eukprot:scaffold2858_cov659-Pavlova_lutheri.AAC.130
MAHVEDERIRKAWEMVDEVMHGAVADRVFPGGAVGVGKVGGMRRAKAYGSYTYEAAPSCSARSVWDAASLTKVMATVPAAMRLWEDGLLDLDATVASYLVEFAQNGKEEITVRQLLSHTAGLRAWYPFYHMNLRTKQDILKFVMADAPAHPVGRDPVYSDLSMLVMGHLVERLSGKSLADFVKEHVFDPIGMTSTGFRSVGEGNGDPGVVPTEVDNTFRNRLLWGEVHDPTAFLFGGCAGNAGLFTSVLDVMKFAEVMVGEGHVEKTGRQVFQPKTVRTFTEPQTARATSYPFALGWDTKLRFSAMRRCPAGRKMSLSAYGHTGFTGTSLWIDPKYKAYVCVLTNSVHPSAEAPEGARICDLRPALGDIAMMMLVGRENLMKTERQLHRQQLLDEARMGAGREACSISWVAAEELAEDDITAQARELCDFYGLTFQPSSEEASVSERDGEQEGLWAADTNASVIASRAAETAPSFGKPSNQAISHEGAFPASTGNARLHEKKGANLSKLRDISLLAFVAVWSLMT